MRRLLFRQTTMSMFKITYVVDGKEFSETADYLDIWEAFRDAKEGLYVLGEKGVDGVLKGIEELE